MRSNIVEGEPGIFPDPVARVMRTVGRVFTRRGRGEPDDETAQTDRTDRTDPTDQADDDTDGTRRPDQADG